MKWLFGENPKSKRHFRVLKYWSNPKVFGFKRFIEFFHTRKTPKPPNYTKRYSIYRVFESSDFKPNHSKKHPYQYIICYGMVWYVCVYVQNLVQNRLILNHESSEYEFRINRLEYAAEGRSCAAVDSAWNR